MSNRDAPVAATVELRILRVVFWLLVGTGIVAFVAAIASMLYAGIGWDARMDAGQSLVIREVIPSLPAGQGLALAYEKVHLTAEFYGILLPQLGDLLNAIATGSIFTGSVDMLQLNNIATYRWQGLANVILSTFAAASLAFAISSTLRSRLAGSFAWALIMTTPLYFGMSYINIKDMPVAAGLTLITAGFMLNRSAQSVSVRWWVAIFLTATGAVIATATRPGLWPLILIFAAMTLGIFGLSDLKNRSLRNSLPGILAVAISTIATLLFLWWSNPFGRLSLFQWLSDSFTVMRNYPWEGTIRVAGIDVASTDLPWWYVPAWVLAQLPILTTVVVSVALVVTVASVFTRSWALKRTQVLIMSPVFLQAIVLPVAVVVTGATLYDAVRHLLFMIPALVGIGSIAIATLEKSAFNWRVSPKVAASVCAVIVVAFSAWATARWIPYSYAFINPIAGWNHPERDWELDFWGITAFEGVDRLRQAELDPIGVLPTEETSSIFGGGSLTGVREANPSQPYGLFVFKRWDSAIGDCEELFSIVRDGQVLGEGAICLPVKP